MWHIFEFILFKIAYAYEQIVLYQIVIGDIGNIGNEILIDDHSWNPHFLIAPNKNPVCHDWKKC